MQRDVVRFCRPCVDLCRDSSGRILHGRNELDCCSSQLVHLRAEEELLFAVPWQARKAALLFY